MILKIMIKVIIHLNLILQNYLSLKLNQFKNQRKMYKNKRFKWQMKFCKVVTVKTKKRLQNHQPKNKPKKLSLKFVKINLNNIKNKNPKN